MTTKERKRSRSVFVICKVGSNIRPLIETLRGLNLEPLNDVVAQGSSTLELITKADLVCAVIEESSNPNVFMELGYALGRGLPVAIFIDGDSDGRLPSDISGFSFFSVPLHDVAALKFHLQVFLQNLDIASPPKPNGRRKSDKQLSASSKVVTSGFPESQLEREVLHTLEMSAEIKSIAPQPGGIEPRTFIPDFAVWLSASTTVVQSPMVIEIKEPRHSEETIDKAVAQLSQYVAASDARTAILLINNSNRSPLRIVHLAPLVFVADIETFKDLLLRGELVKTLSTERNRFAHSAG